MQSVMKSISDPNEIVLSDGSFLRWDKHEGLYRIAYYKRNSIKELDLRSGIALAMKKPPYSPVVDVIMKYLEERGEIEHAASSETMVQ